MPFTILFPVMVGFTDTVPVDICWIKFQGKIYHWDEDKWEFRTVDGKDIPEAVWERAEEMLDNKKDELGHT